MPASKEEIALLKANPATAALGEKLEKELDVMIPKSRFDEVNQQAKDAQAKLDKIATDSAKAEADRLKQQGEFKTLADQNAEKARIAEEAKTKVEQQLADEKKIADAYRAEQQARVDAIKKRLGDKWNDEYSKLSPAALDAIANSLTGTPAGTIEGAPRGNQKKFADMSPDEQAKYIDEAAQGKHTQA